jgi:hypothetical protein
MIMDHGALLSASASGAAVVIVYLAVIVIEIAALWRIFEKAGAPGWAAVIPIYNAYVVLKIVGRPVWWLLLFFIPLVNLIFEIIVANDLSKSFGRRSAFTVGLVLLSPIFIPILGFGGARYSGPAATERYFGGPPTGYGTSPTSPGAGTWGSAPSSAGAGPYAPDGPATGGRGGATSASAWDGGGVAPGGIPADWYADPTGGHQLRYWNGGAWTQHVSDNGVQAVDPV